MHAELHRRVKKAGQPPGTPLYTGQEKNITPEITVICYGPQDFHKTTGKNLEDCFTKENKGELTWLNIDGLNNEKLLEQIAKRYQLHPLTVEDILNVGQRSKIEEFDDYIFITLKMLVWDVQKQNFSLEQLSLVIGKNFVLTFLEHKTPIFKAIQEKLQAITNQRLREKGSDYLAYRLLDTVVDQYFIVLEEIGNEIELLEASIISDPTPENSHALHRLKHSILILRKAIWPTREVISHLLQADKTFITPFTRLYLRDVYDHIAQAIDTVETFRDMLASILDVYLSALSNRMNEVMKVLTMIATIFIPSTFVASIYGMNFKYMPELEWHWGYPAALGVMILIAIVMLFYFRRKKWL